MTVKIPQYNSSRYYSFFILAILATAFGGYMFMEGNTPEVTVLEKQGAPGAVIIFVADPHLRMSNLDYTKKVIDKINSLHPDLVLIGGDFAYRNEEDLTIQEVWITIDAPVYAVLGNHDYQSGDNSLTLIRKMSEEASINSTSVIWDEQVFQDGSANITYADNLVEALQDNGIHVLRNEYRELDINGTKVMLVGIDDCWAAMARPPAIPETRDFTIYMVHEPKCRGNWSADLILTGHTHGGQFVPPGLDKLVTGGLLELGGRFDSGRTTTYITRGLGTSNFDVQLRAFASPEIVVIKGV
ncbi:MAG: metallophosphoesterase [Methanomicrobiales archaeon]